MISPTPTRLVLQPIGEDDPRTMLDDRALVRASTNAFPIVARHQRRRDSAGLLAGGGGALLLGLLTFWSMSGHRHPAPPPAPPRALPAAAPLAPSFAPPPPAVEAAPRGLLMPAVPPMSPAPLTPPAPAPLLVFDAGAPLPATTPGAPAHAATSPLAPGGGENDQFAARVGGTAETATAQPLANPATTVTQGTLIPAVLETAIDTDLPGYVRAVVSRDVKSFDGSQVLIPRSSRLIGQYKSGLSAGQSRAYVIWSRLIRPDGASVALGSPAVDFSGTSGLAGKVNSHFMQRFGAAALLTVIGGLSAVGSPAVVLSGGTSAAGVAAQGTSQIPPTVRVAQGQPIRVFTARDLDFSTVATAPAGDPS
ncbi:TrbI/VirB10 family protein [Sphingomonas morindae]|uniref:Type VI secretion protein n=1 Tax=Sphingomonas morindae TaxID=1541170 RepID=A0ABY4X921_9SPHN|nr:TrbI/VirB10 family protein [Sphingomonas morindae]USI73441.1 type VI secretion protein [Sphingomonas morindae]